MTIRLRPVTVPFQQFLATARRLIGFWSRFMGMIVLLSLVFGPFAPLGFVAILLTLGLPILLLVLWGRSLDTELRWSEMDEGPW